MADAHHLDTGARPPAGRRPAAGAGRRRDERRAVRIEVFPGGQILSPLECFDAASKGMVEAYMASSSYWTAKDPAVEWFVTIPFGMNAEGMDEVGESRSARWRTSRIFRVGHLAAPRRTPDGPRRIATPHVMAGYHEEDFDIWDSRGTLVAPSRQLALLP